MPNTYGRKKTRLKKPYYILHYIQQKKGRGFKSPECIIKLEKPIYLRKYKLF